MTDAILIVGSGSTSRANVEALMDDYFYANQEIKVYLAIDGEISQGQIWAAQYASDKGKTTKALMTRGSRMTGMPTTVPRQESESPIREVCETEKDIAAFVIWNDEDQSCLDALSILPQYGVPALDLTNGLLEIKPVGDIQKVERPEFPEAEVLTAAEELQLDQELDSQVDITEEEEYEDPLYEAINVVAGIFAEAIARELKKVLKK
jgi:hypothetical protein